MSWTKKATSGPITQDTLDYSDLFTSVTIEYTEHRNVIIQCSACNMCVFHSVPPALHATRSEPNLLSILIRVGDVYP